ncbi:hypothetical protein [Lentzea sp. CC55]|uniref:hypothetical protein n=1 Tax=Lentzea sp. CC55 TaxID=2884909 RepID=UPI001F4658F4|nr:hypothetical protein [Lentzea sp. CC55]MCG8925036.1 hypothetical protein [Lentzea sp. CC55]
MSRAGVTVAAAAAALLVSAGVASAGDGGVSVADNSGYADWIENGDTLTVCDQRADGWGVRGYIYRPYAGDPANGTVLIKASDPSYNGECVSVSENIDESVAISIKVCNYKDSSIIYCQHKRLR